MGAVSPGRQLLLRMVRRPDEQIDMIRAALAIAWEDLGAVDVEEALRDLQGLVARTREHLIPAASTAEQAERVLEYLHGVEGFVGNMAAYYDPANSYLPEVLERRVGLPITLSLVLLHVGWQLGLPFEPADLPGHFMVRCPDPGGSLFLDLFHGRVLDNAQCRAFLQNQRQHEVPDPDRFPPPSRRRILARMLRNLKGSYVRQEDWLKALAATERILILDPDASEDIRDRGLLRARLGDLHLALLDLERYAMLEPMAADQALIRKHAQTVAEVLGQRN